MTTVPLAIDDTAADVLFRAGRTAYSFTDEQVSDEQLAQIYELMRHAPTAMNSQPLRVVFVRYPCGQSAPAPSPGGRKPPEG